MKREGEQEVWCSDGQMDKGGVTSSTHGIILHTVCQALDVRHYISQNTGSELLLYI